MSLGVAIFALSAVLLFFKMMVVVCLQGYYRISQRHFALPEDARFFGKDAEVKEADLQIVQRAQNCLRNDGENIPFFLVLGAIYLFLEIWPTGVLIYFPAFVIARYLHTLFYLRPTQPLRNRVYSLGVLANLCLAIHILAALVQNLDRIS